MSAKKKVSALLLAAALTGIAPAAGAADTERVFEWEGKNFPYSVSPAGDSYHFHFDNGPESEVERRKAKRHILQSLFDDPSIDFTHKEDYIRERAKCSFFGGTFYDYTLCILPNEYAPGKQNGLKGFVTQLPNSLWLLTRIVLPVALAVGLLYLLARTRAE